MEKSVFEIIREDDGTTRVNLIGIVPVEIVMFHMKLWLEAQELIFKKTYRFEQS